MHDTPSSSSVKQPGSALDPLWFKDAIIYELHVKAFEDANNDGIGDFQGLLSKLDYLQELGITCIWLLPFFASPLRDDGYDIADYMTVHPSYGTLEDFQTVLHAAHDRGLQVMIELVVNHTSDQHAWFQRARLAPPGSPERDYYVWSDTDEKYKDARIIFTDTEKSNWTWDPIAKAYYWHRFFSHQPDLNYDNPLVLNEVLRVMRFWLDMGVDALRIDAIPYLVERDGTNCENLPETHAVMKKIRAEIDAHYENRIILAEANQWPADVRPYFADGDECHMAFHFPLMPRMYMALRQEDRLPITEIMGQTPPIPDSCQWGLFLRNHDELTLEMVSEDERDYMYLAYSADPRMRINIGIRRRLAPLLDNNRRRIELLNSLLFSFPGTPILYYGDEIGMGDNIYLGDRNGVRTPMQWSADRNAGFSRAVPAKLYSPVVMDPVWGYEAINVEAQQGDSSSLLNWMRNLIALRKLFRVFGRGALKFLNPENRKVIAYVREAEDEIVLCVANLSRFAQPAQLDLSEYDGMIPSKCSATSNSLPSPVSLTQSPSRPMDFSGWNCIPRPTRRRFSRKIPRCCSPTPQTGPACFSMATCASCRNPFCLRICRCSDGSATSLPPFAAPPLPIGERSTTAVPSSAWSASSTIPETRTAIFFRSPRLLEKRREPFATLRPPRFCLPCSPLREKVCCTTRPSTRIPARPCCTSSPTQPRFPCSKDRWKERPAVHCMA